MLAGGPRDVTTTVLRKVRRLGEDAALRRWAAGRLLGRLPGPPRFTPHRPPYLKESELPRAIEPYDEHIASRLPSLSHRPPSRPIVLPLPGETITLDPEQALTIYDREFADIETLLAVHRFAWLPLLGSHADPAWVDALWRAWATRFAQPDRSWAWHPYTAAERAINILDFARRNGLPGERKETLDLLSRHTGAIAGALEYFGDHNTSNHLSNNGRALYLLGLALGIERATETGARILLSEAERLFLPSGVLREGSSHYHLLLSRNFCRAWLAAREHGRPEEKALADIAARALAVVPQLSMPGGFPLIGDISPDCPPDFLAALTRRDLPAAGWARTLDEGERAALGDLMATVTPVPIERLDRDGWVRFAAGPWTALWHVSPEGWPPMPGHAHQDMGSGEIHHGDIPLFVDPGRGRYGEKGNAAWAVSGAAHNGLLIDGHDPYPPNKPYYDTAFRRRLCGPPPRVRRTADGVSIAFFGFARLGRVGAVERRFAFDAAGLTIEDRIDGRRRAHVVRRLHTPFPVENGPDGITIRARRWSFRISGDGKPEVCVGRRWTAYGVPAPATIIEFSDRVRLPARLGLRVECTA